MQYLAHRRPPQSCNSQAMAVSPFAHLSLCPAGWLKMLALNFVPTLSPVEAGSSPAHGLWAVPNTLLLGLLSTSVSPSFPSS